MVVAVVVVGRGGRCDICGGVPVYVLFFVFPLQDLLSDADFEAVFKISREKFKAEPGWRQRHRKKSVMWIQ
jgi:hypothetical protein